MGPPMATPTTLLSATSSATSLLSMSTPTATARPPERPTAMPISAAAIFFITSGLLTISLLYRLIHLFRGLHLSTPNPTFPFSPIPIPDLLFTTITFPTFLTATYFCITLAQRITEFGLSPPDPKSREARLFNTEATILECLSIAILCFGKLPVWVVANWGIQERGVLAGRIGWPLRTLVKILPWPHILLHATALAVNAALPRSIGGIVVELSATVVSDVALLIIAGVMLLDPKVRGRCTKVQFWGGWAAWGIGGFEMLAGIARGAVSVRVGGLRGLEGWGWGVCEREERRVLMVALQSGCAVVAGGLVGFRGVGGGKEKGESGPGIVAGERGRSVGLGVWRVEEGGKGKAVEGLEGRGKGRRSTFWG